MTCRLSQIVERPQELLEAFDFPVDLSAIDDWRVLYNIAPGGRALIVHGEPTAAKATVMNWAQGVGRLRPWARDDTFVKGRYSFAQRCVIPVPGFYDWPSRTKTAFFVQPADRKILTLAGIFVEHDKGGTFAVMTTEPNADIKPLHHRMAIFLEPRECEQWLNPDTPAEQLHALMKQWPEGRLKNYPVSTRVHNARYDDEACIEPLKKKRASRPSGLER
jgi:putative SOS response-associated peptidase YedK